MVTKDENLSLAALRSIAGMATRCVPCGMRGLCIDAVTLATKFFEGEPNAGASILLCRDCLTRENENCRYDSLTPVKQPASVEVARKALAQIETEVRQ